MSTRRNFILQSCSLCASAVGFSIFASELESCKTPGGLSETVKGNQLTVPLKIFDEQKNYLIKDFSLPYNILVVKHPDGTFTALQMRCTHKNYSLRVAPDKIICDNHGSTFDLDGNATKSPAFRPLTKYLCTMENDVVVVHLA